LPIGHRQNFVGNGKISQLETFKKDPTRSLAEVTYVKLNGNLMTNLLPASDGDSKGLAVSLKPDQINLKKHETQSRQQPLLCHQFTIAADDGLP
jgi:hypothetical protein